MSTNGANGVLYRLKVPEGFHFSFDWGKSGTSVVGPESDGGEEPIPSEEGIRERVIALISQERLIRKELMSIPGIPGRLVRDSRDIRFRGVDWLKWARRETPPPPRWELPSRRDS
jgi:hypothetical protein